MLSLVRGATACARSLEAVARPLAVRAYAKPARGGDDSSGDARSQYFLKLLEPQQTEKIERTPEELEDAMQRSKEFSRQKMRQHRAFQRDITTKIYLKKCALAALPPHLREAAEEDDDEPFPLDLPGWVDTPALPEEAATPRRARASGKLGRVGTKGL